MTRIEKRVFRNSVLVGMLVTLFVLALQVMGLLAAPENWLYDWRARHFQFHTQPPTDKLVHLDIDDSALEGIGRWPWPRQQMAEMVDEMHLAGAKAIGLDIIYPEAQAVDHVIRTQPDGTQVVGDEIDHDGLFAAAIKRSGNVVVPASVPLTSDEGDRLKRAVIEQLTADLELSEIDLAARLKADGFRDADVDERAKVLWIPMRRVAAYRRIRREMASKELTADQLRALILRRTDVNIASPLSRVIDEQYEIYRKVQSVLALGGAMPKGMAPLLQTDIYLAPVARLSAAAASSAFVDFYPSSDGILRSVPLLVDCEGRLFPHLGLSLALQYLDVKVDVLSFDGQTITIPRAGELPIEIPVRTLHSAALGRDVPATMDLPWFGTSNWQTMYDYPGHQQIRQHVSMTQVWEPCLIRQKIVKNNHTLDVGLEQFGKVFGLPPLPKLADDDFAGRLPRIDQIVNSEDFKAYLKQYQEMAPKDLDNDGRAFLAAANDLNTIRRENTLQLGQLQAQRAKVKALLNGKAALVGFTATGNEDAVATSIHGRCPGVIAHGVVFNSILTGEFWRSSPRWINYLLTVVLGVLTALLAGRLHWQWAFLIVSAMGVAFVGLNGLYLFDTKNILLDLAAPQIAMAGVWSACSIVRIYMETIERKRVERKFRSYVDPDVVNATMERGDAATAGESRELTVAFTDLVGFTSLSERLGEKTVPMLNDYLDRMVPIIYKKHGIMKFLGDGIMYFYGSPYANADHAADAVLTALEMQKELEAFNQELQAKHLPTLGMRIGINTGLMVVGDAGSRDPIQRHEYTVLGDAVNFASRLESANKYTGTSILISARTAQLCGDRFLLRPVGALQVVGKTEVVLTFEVCGLADAADERKRTLCDHTRVMVDSFRGREFETVLKLVEQLDQAHGPSPLTALYRDLAESYLLNPPEPTFDGRIEFDKK